MNKNNHRLTRIEDVFRQRRDARIAQIVDAMHQRMNAEDVDMFAAALERDIRDGAEAEYTPTEIDAMGAFDAMCAARPDIAALVAEIGQAGNVD